MSIPGGVRRLVLTVHVVTAVGWLGAVAAYLPLAVVALTSQDPGIVRSAYVGMDLVVRYVIVPLSLASLASGLLQSLLGRWGVVRHYWVVFKLAINVFSVGILLLYVGSLESYTDVAAGAGTLSTADLLHLRDPTHVFHATIAMLLLLAATVLAVYKPRGLTPLGVRRQRQERAARA